MSCDFCNKEFGRSFSVKHHHTQIQQPDNGQIVQSKNDTSGIVLWRHGTASGYFDIQYCPFCGDRLK